MTCTLSRDLGGRGEMACTSPVQHRSCAVFLLVLKAPALVHLPAPNTHIPGHPYVQPAHTPLSMSHVRNCRLEQGSDGGQWDTPVRTQVSSRLRTESPGWGGVYARENTGVKSTNHCNTVITGATKKGQKRGRNQRLRKVGARRLWKLSRRLCEQFGEPDQQMMGTEDAIIPGTFHIDYFLRSFNNNNGYHYWGTTISQARLNIT